MFSKISKLESMLQKLAESLGTEEKKRYTASQYLNAHNINLAEGATLNIHMSNTILSIEIVSECINLIEDLKFRLPIKGELGLKGALNNYENILIQKALERTDNNREKAADLLGITNRQLRYLTNKRRES